MKQSERIAFLCFFLFGFAFCQDADISTLPPSLPGPVIHQQMEELKSLLQNEVTPILTSVHKAAKDLNSVVEETEIQKQEFMKYKEQFMLNLATIPKNCLSDEIVQHTVLLNSWSFKGCENFTDDCIAAAKIAFNASLVAFRIAAESSGIVTDVMNCPSWNLVRSYKCYKRNIQEVKDLIDYAKTYGLPLIKEAALLGKHLRLDFHKCLGIAELTQQNIALQFAKCS